MRRIRTLALGLLTLALMPLPCEAQWGWPPPGYSTSTFQAPDGGCYRRLCGVLRDRRRPHCPPAPVERAGCGVSGPAVPQGPPAAGARP